MGQHRKNDNPLWKESFGNFLKELFEDVYEVDYKECASKYFWHDSTVRFWMTGRNLPQLASLRDLMAFFKNCSSCNPQTQEKFYREVYVFFSEKNMLSIYGKLLANSIDFSDFTNGVLKICYELAKGKELDGTRTQVILPTGKTKAVVFDFDGTLTSGKTNRTTWENLWEKLGYDVKECQELHQKFNQHEITHDEWCKITAEKFIARRLNKDVVLEIASKIKLIPGLKETFDELEKRNIKIYIVSGSILTVIKSVLGNQQKYVNEIKANEFDFDRNNKLLKIIGTRYDFHGKATFINQISQDMKIAPQDILFVGNSLNDRFVYLSGVITLCINPTLTNPADTKTWNYCIQTCENLTEILQFLDKKREGQEYFYNSEIHI